jgi:hypothetical protein
VFAGNVQQPRRVCLFNDLILFGKRARKGQYDFRGCISLQSISVFFLKNFFEHLKLFDDG